jgi:hypothetical protein
MLPRSGKTRLNSVHSAHLVLDSDDAIEHDGAVATLDVVERIDGAIDAEAADEREPGQGAGRPRVRHLDVAHVVEIHDGLLGATARCRVSTEL